MARPFGDVLGELAHGQTYHRLTDQLQEIVQAVQDTHKTGELQLTLKVKPNGAHGVIIAETIRSKIPEATRGETNFFVDGDGGLHRDNPNQQKLPLRKVGERQEDAAAEGAS